MPAPVAGLICSTILACLPKTSLAATTEIGGLLETEMFFGETFDGESYSDLVLATIEVGLDAEITNWFSGHVLLLHEEFSDNIPHLHAQGQTGMLVDEAYIEFGNPFLSSFSLQVGHIYIPFGNYQTNMVSDPFTLEIGESRESAIVLNYDRNFYFSLYMFNGDLMESGGDNAIDNMGVNLGYAYQGDTISFDIGVGYINNIKETDGLSNSIINNRDTLNESIPGLFPDPVEVEEYTAGIATHLVFNWGNITFIGELVAAMDDFAADELYASKVAKPSASNVEVAYSINDNLTMALGFQNSVDMASYLPENRTIFGVSYQLDTGTSLAFEFASDKDFGASDGGSGESASTTTIQLAAEF
jgi:hypothetical protein